MIRMAVKDEVSAIMNFIDTYWKKGHILAVNEEMFRYEFETDDGLNIVLSVNDDGVIDGMEGYIPYAHHSRDSMLSMWKVNKTDNPMLGIEILQYIKEHTGSRIIASPGINKRTKGIYDYLGMHTGKLKQWYRLASKEIYSVAMIKNNQIPLTLIPEKKIVKFNSFSELIQAFDFEKYKRSNPKPYKEPWYVEKRYFNNPIYKYDVYGVVNGSGCGTLLVFRKQPFENSNACRFVDVIGNFNDVYSCTKAIDHIMMDMDAEYVDFYELGMNDQLMQQSGWIEVETSGNVIPNYFSPFVCQNVDIYYTTSDKDIHLFKADGDQDRPN